MLTFHFNIKKESIYWGKYDFTFTLHSFVYWKSHVEEYIEVLKL